MGVLHVRAEHATAVTPHGRIANHPSWPAAGLALILAVSTACAPATAHAHTQPYTFLDLHFAGDSLSGRLMAHIEDLARNLAATPPDSLLDPAYDAAHRDALTGVLAPRLDLRLDGRRVVPEFEPAIETIPDRKLVVLHFRARVSSPLRITVRGPLFAEDPQHETFLNVYEGERLAHEDLLDASRHEADFLTTAKPATRAIVRTFVAEGVHHIFIGPDHVLFIVGLLLLGGSLGRLLKIVTAFTVAHSLTLALATLHLVNPPSRVIEPAIALSIVAVGVENLVATRRGRDWRAPLAFGFGFLHGFGFASVLAGFGLPRASLGWSLFSFNVGVEIGQACIVLAVAPLLAWIGARAPRMGLRVAAWGSAVVIAAGSFWFVQRVLAA